MHSRLPWSYDNGEQSAPWRKMFRDADGNCVACQSDDMDDAFMSNEDALLVLAAVNGLPRTEAGYFKPNADAHLSRERSERR